MELTKRYETFFGLKGYQNLIEKQRELYKKKTIRINISKIKQVNVENFLKNKNMLYEVNFIPNSFTIKKSFFNISSSIFSLSGKIYIQDLASLTPIYLLYENFLIKNKKNKLKILDMAASPGSKTTQLADYLTYLGIEYEIYAIEKNKERISKLINNIQKQAFENIRVFNLNTLNMDFNIKFDIIILDAPCSGNLIKDVNWLNKRNIKGIIEKSCIQKELLKKAKKQLKHNGILIYSTCSIEPEENEENILFAINKLNFEEINLSKKLPFTTKSDLIFENKDMKLKYKQLNSIRLFPPLSNSQGFFISFLKLKNKN